MWYSIRSPSPIGGRNQILKKMPVKIETYSQSRLSPTPVFDCASLLFSEFESADFISETNFPCLDDLWNTNFIPTPPQSPQIIKEEFDDGECFTNSSTGIHISDVGCGGSSSSSVGGSCSNSPISGGLTQNNGHGGKLLDTYVSHDCMWSGQCMEGLCKSMYSNKPISNVARIIRPETPFHLFSTSPQNGSFSYISPLEGNIEYMEEEAAQQSHEQHQLHQQNQPTSLLPIDNSNHNNNGNFLAMSNDHSYQCQTAQRNFENNHNGNSLIVKTKNDYCKSRNSSNKNANTKATISQPKISKCRKISTKRSNSNSLLNNDSTNGVGVGGKGSNTNGSKKENNKNSVLKPTIISVANFKNIPDSFHTKYKVSIKKKRLDDNNAVGCSSSIINNSSKPVIQVKSLSKKVSANSSFSSMSLNNSPACSDSEESSLSFPSSADDPNKTSSPPVKRREHNDSERKRRDHLRNSFNNLRDQIPLLKQSKKRPPRIMILHEATSYVEHLIDKNQELVDCLQEEMQKQQRLMEMLKMSN